LYDAATKRLYSTGSAKSGEHEGFIEAYKQLDPTITENGRPNPHRSDGGHFAAVAETGGFMSGFRATDREPQKYGIYETR